MRWWPFKRKAPHSNGGENGGAAQARSQAEQKLREAYRHQREVNDVVKASDELLRQNRFGEQIQQAFRRAT